jgi:hypothetical protein
MIGSSLNCIFFSSEQLPRICYMLERYYRYCYLVYFMSDYGVAGLKTNTNAELIVPWLSTAREKLRLEKAGSVNFFN